MNQMSDIHFTAFAGQVRDIVSQAHAALARKDEDYAIQLLRSAITVARVVASVSAQDNSRFDVVAFLKECSLEGTAL